MADKEQESHEHEREIRMSLLQQEARQLEQQLQMIEQQIVELQILKLNLDEFEKSKEKDELLSSMGRNIFIKTSLLSKDLLVDVGAKTLVKKTVSETKEIIDKDVGKLAEARSSLVNELERISAEMQKAV